MVDGETRLSPSIETSLFLPPITIGPVGSAKTLVEPAALNAFLGLTATPIPSVNEAEAGDIRDLSASAGRIVAGIETAEEDDADDESPSITAAEGVLAGGLSGVSFFFVEPPNKLHICIIRRTKFVFREILEVNLKES